MTKEEKNRKIAEGLFGWKMIEGYHPEIDGPRSDPGRWHLRRRWFLDDKPMACEECGNFPDYHTDESANALILDRMLERFSAVLSKDYIRFEPLLGRYYEGTGDRKTAICEAALKFIDTLKES